MRSRVVGSLLTLAIVAVCLASESAAQGNSPTARSQGGVVLPIRGTTSTGGTFDGLFALQRFASGNNGAIVAVGVISGTVLTNAGAVVGTVLTPVRLPVPVDDIKVIPRSQTGFAPAPSGMRAVWDHEAPPPAPGIVLAQAPPTNCGVLSLTIGGIDLNVLGLVVTLEDIVLEISGDTSGPLGALICGVLSVLTNAVGSLVNLLNTILGLLGGLTGGLGA
jgi:hypothetical protein